MRNAKEIVLSQDDLKELFSLFSSPTDEELVQTYDPSNRHYFLKTRLDEMYQLVEERKEFALDAWRAVMYFLHRHDFQLTKGGTTFDLCASSGYLEQSKFREGKHE